MDTLHTQLVEAVRLAAELHADQRRKGREVPYVSHLLSVAGLVIEHGGDADQAAAAVLHDAIEDRHTVGGVPTEDRIRGLFNERVTRIVLDCSDNTDGTKPMHKDPQEWRKRKQAYIAGFSTKHPDSLLVIAADKLHNARSILSDYRQQGEPLWQRFTGRREGTLWYYRELTGLLGERLPEHSLVRELERTVQALEREAGG